MKFKEISPLLLALFFLTNSCTDNRSGNEANAKGVAYLQRKDYDLAIKEFNKAIRVNPNLACVYGNRGNAYREKGDFNRGISDFDAVLRINSKDVLAYYNRGLTYHKKGELEQAISDYNKALELNPKLIEAYGNRANAYQEKGDLDSAISDLTKAIELTPGNTIFYYSAGARVKAVKAENPYCAINYYNRGNIYSQKGNFLEAILDYERALQIKPDLQADLKNNLSCAYNNKAYSYYSLGENLEEGLKMIDKAIALMPNNGIYLGTKAELLYRRGDYSKAYEYIKKAIALEPNHPELEKDLENIEEAIKKYGQSTSR